MVVDGRVKAPWSSDFVDDCIRVGYHVEGNTLLFYGPGTTDLVRTGRKGLTIIALFPLS